jgi:hypothetical protein
MAVRLENPYDDRIKSLLQDSNLILGIDKVLEEVKQQITSTWSTQKQNVIFIRAY